MIRYSLADFNEILESSIISQLPDETIKTINILANQVGAPEYIKTPQFKNKIMGNGAGQNIRRRKKFQEINDDDWETIRSFQTTEFQKKEGIEKNIFSIRKYLNMLTINTYDKLRDNIIEEITIVNSTKTENDLNYLCKEFFNIVINNILYSDIYAKLYKDLIEKFSIFKDILKQKFSELENNFNNIEYFDPETNYDKFCENNKKNELLRSTCTFYVNLMKEGIIEIDQIGNIIQKLFTILENMIQQQTKKNEIYNNIVKITNIKLKDKPGITNKCIFKHMDILDELG